MVVMNRTVSVIYSVVVVIVLIGVIGYYGWNTYDSRSKRIGEFLVRSENYAELLSDSLISGRDVNAEVEFAEKLMAGDAELAALQVYSPSDGLRISVVKPPASEFRSSPLAGSDRFSGFFSRIRCQIVRRPMPVEGLPDLEAYFLLVSLSSAELRNNLLIILVTILGLLIITLAMIFIRPAENSAGEPSPDDGAADDSAPADASEEDFSLPDDLSDDFSDDFSEALPDDLSDDLSNDLPDGLDDDLPDASPNHAGGDELPISDDFDFGDFDEADQLDENDLWGSKPEIGDSVSLDDTVDIPDLDDFPPPEAETDGGEDILKRLQLELERAASFHQDLSLTVFSDLGDDSGIQDSFINQDLIFSLDNGRLGVIEVNKNLDETLAGTEDILRGRIQAAGNRSARAGIASRNGRLISAENLWNEAETALLKTDESNNIAAFRADPEKYRRYLKEKSR